MFLQLLATQQQASAAASVSTPTHHASLKAASEAAAADQSLVLLVFGAEWCGPCKLLKTKTLSSREFAEQGGALQIVHIDVDSEPSMARDYNVQAVPTLFLLTAESKIVSRREGFLETADLLLWLKESRERAREGKWEGTVPGSKLKELITKAAADQLDTNDFARLISTLGEPNPADRDEAARLLIAQREQAVPPLIDALTNSYLGIRIAAYDALHKLVPDATSIDPWQPPSELTEAVDSIRKWWTGTGKLPSQPAESPGNITAASINGALDSLRGNDPMQRTKAMSALVAYGTPALPAIRDAIKQSDKAGDQRSLTLLEDVRWAILIPDEVERRAVGVRNVLGRGKGAERQSAAARLDQAGRLAIPALAELVDDSDPLVVESAVRALSNVGGKDAIPAMAALLKAADSNLRMTAAQALGHTKNVAAVSDLLTVLNDPNEVVACAALSALEEINGQTGYSPSKKPQPPEVVEGLKRCLGESRWRVRAAAAEVTGKLGASELVNDLNGLLNDPDGFVVRNSLEALQKLGATTDSQKLLAVAQQHADLRGETIELLAKGSGEDAVKALTDLYRSSSTDQRIVIVQALGASSQPNQDTTPWPPLLGQAITDSDPKLRRAVAKILAAQPPKIAAALVGSLLSDQDEETRTSAAAVVLSVIGRERQALSTSHGSSSSQFMMIDDVENSFGTSRRRAVGTNELPAAPEQISSWHDALQQSVSKKPDLVNTAALYVTGSSNSDLPTLTAAITGADNEALDRLSRSAAVAAILPRLPWPDGKPIVERFCASPSLFLKMTFYAQQAPTGLSDFLFEPQRFRAAVEPASSKDLEANLQWLLSAQQKGFSLVSNNPRSQAVVTALLDATNAAWKAAAVYCLGLRDEPQSRDYLERALADSNAWVRVTAVSCLAKAIRDRPALEKLLGPLLADPNKKVAEKAMVGLLEPEIRSAAGLDYSIGNFEFEKIYVWSGSYEPSIEQRPLVALQGNPPFLEIARQKLATAAIEEAAMLTLLLAQYGDFTGVNRFMKETPGQDREMMESVVLTVIGLSRDSSYLPYVKKRVATAKDEQEFRKLLQAIRGINGAEARELRADINKRMRQGRE